MEQSNKRIVEINGVKIEVDLSTAKVVSEYRVGDKVKLLKREYTDKYKVYPGVITSFDDFEKLPTLTVAYLDIDYSGADVKFQAFNSEIADVELAPMNDKHELSFKKADVISYLDREILKKEQELIDARNKRNFFENNFAKHFETV
jgi:hypothetical protein